MMQAASQISQLKDAKNVRFGVHVPTAVPKGNAYKKQYGNRKNGFGDFQLSRMSQLKEKALLYNKEKNSGNTGYVAASYHGPQVRMNTNIRGNKIQKEKFTTMFHNARTASNIHESKLPRDVPVIANFAPVNHVKMGLLKSKTSYMFFHGHELYLHDQNMEKNKFHLNLELINALIAEWHLFKSNLINNQ